MPPMMNVLASFHFIKRMINNVSLSFCNLKQMIMFSDDQQDEIKADKPQ
jgi:hypothetical protein